MSNAVSALDGASFDGLVAVSEAGLAGMITLRGDLKSPELGKAVTAQTGLYVPAQREAVFQGDQGVLWMSPDELMILCPYAEAERQAVGLSEALAGTHALAVNVSDARALFHISGAEVRDVLAKLAPVDLSSEAFGPGQVRRTRLAQSAAAFWMVSDTEARVIFFRSVAQYMFDRLSTAAQPGSSVVYFAAQVAV